MNVRRKSCGLVFLSPACLARRSKMSITLDRSDAATRCDRHSVLPFKHRKKQRPVLLLSNSFAAQPNPLLEGDLRAWWKVNRALLVALTGPNSQFTPSL
jgi:hypothetical protein